VCLIVRGVLCSSRTLALISNANSVFFSFGGKRFGVGFLLNLDHAEYLLIAQPGGAQCGNVRQ
jgi:hypothetical protein